MNIRWLLDNFVYVWAALAALGVARLALKLYRKKKRGANWPELTGQALLYQENYASGYSRKNWRTRLSGASRCLKIAVTDKEIHTGLISPVSLFVEKSDLDHSISRSSIRSVVPKRESGQTTFHVTFVDANHQVHELVLLPTDPDAFAKSIGAQPASRTDRPVINPEKSVSAVSFIRDNIKYLLPLGLFPAYVVLVIPFVQRLSTPFFLLAVFVPFFLAGSWSQRPLRNIRVPFFKTSVIWVLATFCLWLISLFVAGLIQTALR